MIVLLYQQGCETAANQAFAAIRIAFDGRVAITCSEASTVALRTAPPEPDDLLVVMFDAAASFPIEASQFIESYRRARPDNGLLLPVATTSTSPVPPAAAEDIKALAYDIGSPHSTTQLVHRVGAMLYMKLQGRDTRIFLSHSARDGRNIAAQLHRHFSGLGYRPYLDEAIESDGFTSMTPGCRAQAEIDKTLADASLLLLIDTPAVPGSKWIRHEIGTANGLILPIFSLCFRSSADPQRGPRFGDLLSLRRWLELPMPDSTCKDPLSADQLSDIEQTAESYLCEVLQRKVRVPFLVEKLFAAASFDWRVLDPRRQMYRSERGQRVVTRVLTHCSIYDVIYGPSLRHFKNAVEDADWANHSLYIYDGTLLPYAEFEEHLSASDRVLILHHQELPKLLHSQFTTLE